MIESVRDRGTAAVAELDLDPGREAAAAREVLPFVRPGASILELGCGAGWSSLLLAARAGTTAPPVVAWDPDPAAVAVARLHADAAGFGGRIAAAQAIGAAAGDRRFDLVVASHRVGPADALAIAAERLRPHGRLWLRVPQDRHPELLPRLCAAGWLVSRPLDGAPVLVPDDLRRDAPPTAHTAADTLLRCERLVDRIGFSVRVHDEPARLLAAFGIDAPGLVLEDDLDVIETDCDRHDRKRRDAEVLCGLARGRPGPCLDLGTSHGRSAYRLATNVAPHVVTTVNMLPEQAERAGVHVTHVLQRHEIGSYPRERSVHNIRQLYANTLDWDWQGVPDDLQLAFVDACHDAEAVRSDSLHAWRRLVPGGFLVWHDFSPALAAVHPWIATSLAGVRAFLAEAKPRGCVHHALGSWCGVLQKQPEDGVAHG